MNSLLCESPDRARANRERVACGVGADGYDAHTGLLFDNEDIYLATQGRLLTIAEIEQIRKEEADGTGTY